MPAKKSKLHESFLFAWMAMRRPADPLPHQEYFFAKESFGRKWRFDFAFPEYKIAVECEGGLFAGGGKLCPVCKQPPRSRHTAMSGVEKDIEKYNHAAALGWKVFKVSAKTMSDNPGQVIDLIHACMG